MKYSKIGLFHLISAPPRLRTDVSLLPLKNSIKKCYPLKTSLRNGFTPEEFHKKSIYPWRIPWNLCLFLKNSTYNMGFTPKEFPSFWPLPLKNSTTFIPYPWRIPLFLNRGVRILNGIAHYQRQFSPRGSTPSKINEHSLACNICYV